MVGVESSRCLVTTRAVRSRQNLASGVKTLLYSGVKTLLVVCIFLTRCQHIHVPMWSLCNPMPNRALLRVYCVSS